MGRHIFPVGTAPGPGTADHRARGTARPSQHPQSARPPPAAAGIRNCLAHIRTTTSRRNVLSLPAAKLQKGKIIAIRARGEKKKNTLVLARALPHCGAGATRARSGRSRAAPAALPGPAAGPPGALAHGAGRGRRRHGGGAEGGQAAAAGGAATAPAGARRGREAAPVPPARAQGGCGHPGTARAGHGSQASAAGTFQALPVIETVTQGLFRRAGVSSASQPALGSAAAAPGSGPGGAGVTATAGG